MNYYTCAPPPKDKDKDKDKVSINPSSTKGKFYSQRGVVIQFKDGTILNCVSSIVIHSELNYILSIGIFRINNLAEHECFNCLGKILYLKPPDDRYPIKVIGSNTDGSEPFVCNIHSIPNIIKIGPNEDNLYPIETLNSYPFDICLYVSVCDKCSKQEIKNFEKK